MALNSYQESILKDGEREKKKAKDKVITMTECSARRSALSFQVKGME